VKANAHLLKITPLSSNFRIRAPVEEKNLTDQLVVFFISDFLFSIIPITFIVRIQRPLLEKIAIGLIMGLGLLASISGVIKLIHISRWAVTKDPTWDLVPSLTWSHMEEFTAIIAACIPCLKSLTQKIIREVASHLTWLKNSKNGSSDMDMSDFNGYVSHPKQAVIDIPEGDINKMDTV
jgi:hypothetical protein